MIILLSFLIGLFLGSFSNVCILRLPAEKSIVWPGSHCPFCETPLKVLDNIPLLSFAWRKGQCRSCSHPISYQYPIVELAMGLFFVFSAWHFKGDILRLIIVDILSFYLFSISVIDYRHRIIPDELSLSLIVLGWLLSYINPLLVFHRWPGVLESVLAALAGGLGMLGLAWLGEKVFKKEALGGGDIKLVAAFGAILGWQGLFASVFLGSLLGGVVGLLLLSIKSKKRGDTVPFGPFLSLGAYLYCFLPASWLQLLFPFNFS